MTVNANGRANMARVQRALGSPWLAQLEGESDWKARVGVRNKVTDIVIESDLVGVTSRLPPPFAKPAAEPLPLRVQRRSRGAEQSLQVSLGQRLSAVFALETSGKTTRVKRGAVNFGTGCETAGGAGHRGDRRLRPHRRRCLARSPPGRSRQGR